MSKYVKIAVILLFANDAAAAMAEDPPDFRAVFGLPSFVLRVQQAPDSSQDKTEVHVRIGLVNDVLQFVKQDDDTYQAGYELSLDIVDSKNNHVDGGVSGRKIFAKTFEETNSRSHFNTESLAFRLPAGQYRFHLEIVDVDTRKRLRREELVKVKAFSKEQRQLSSLRLLESREGSLEQNLARLFTEHENDIVLQYSGTGFVLADSVLVRYELKNWQDKLINQWSQKYAPNAGRFDVQLALNPWLDGPGQYKIALTCLQDTAMIRAEESFSAKFMPDDSVNAQTEELTGNVDFRAMRYIMKGGAFKLLAEADSSTREQNIARFWRERDPTPDTAENELHDEFSRRVRFSDQHFTVLARQRQGWQTDRGKIYIRYGKPDIVRKQSNDIGDTPVEVWFYKKLDKRIVFRDKDGDGDYKILYEE